MIDEEEGTESFDEFDAFTFFNGLVRFDLCFCGDDSLFSLSEGRESIINLDLNRSFELPVFQVQFLELGLGGVDSSIDRVLAQWDCVEDSGLHCVSDGVSTEIEARTDNEVKARFAVVLSEAKIKRQNLLTQAQRKEFGTVLSCGVPSDLGFNLAAFFVQRCNFDLRTRRVDCGAVLIPAIETQLDLSLLDIAFGFFKTA